MRIWKARLRVEAPDTAGEVTNLELFFDLVFVFTITQVTRVVRDSSDAQGYVHAGLILCITWWMYDGYAWLSNNVGPNSVSTRVPMLVGMLGFLTMAIATPNAFGNEAWPFAIAYLLVVLVHAVQFMRSSLGGSARAIWHVLPINLAVAAGLFAAAIIGPRWGWIGWTVSFAILLYAVVTHTEMGFGLRAGHFAERHQLLIIIALGETVVATGVGAEDRLNEWPVVLAVVLSMALLSSLWWVYFGGDNDRGAQALEDSPPRLMLLRAFWAYSLGHLIHIVGLVLVAAGLLEVIARPRHELDAAAALTLAIGTATFLASEILFRHLLALGRSRYLIVGAVLAVPTALVGHFVYGLAQLLTLSVVVIVILLPTLRPERAPVHEVNR